MLAYVQKICTEKTDYVFKHLVAHMYDFSYSFLQFAQCFFHSVIKVVCGVL